MDLPHVVIVGAGFGGINAARVLGRASFRVTVVDRSNYHLFQPLLYQVATAGLSPADIAAPVRSILSRYRNVDVLMAEVHGVDPVAKKVLFADHSLSYDSLILATGSRHSYFGHDEWEQFAPGLKSISDATRIRRQILLSFERAEMEADIEKRKALLRIVIVGGGPTGVELAGAIAELTHKAMASDFRYIDPKETEVLLIEAGPRLLAAFDDSLSNRAALELERLGVRIRTGGRVESVDAQGVLLSGDRIEANTVIWAAGVKASPVGRWLGLETDRSGRVAVLPDLSIPGHPEIFVIGDAALAIENGKPLPGVAPVAMQQGRYVGKVLAGLVDRARTPFRYVDKGNMATVGRGFAIAQFRNMKLRGLIAWLAWLLVHVYYLIGFRNRILVLFQWAWAYFTFQRGARLIVEENSVASSRHADC